MNEIIDPQRDPHANGFALCEEYTFGLGRFYLPLPFGLRESLFAQCWGSLTASFDTATFCVCVLAVGVRIRVTHGIYGSKGISNFFLAF